MGDVAVHGAERGPDVVVAERTEPACGAHRLIGVGPQQVNEEYLRETIDDERPTDGARLDLVDEQIAQVREELAARIVRADVNERRQEIEQERRSMATAFRAPCLSRSSSARSTGTSTGPCASPRNSYPW